jgi:D-alanyl-lipoteichoic acid acyltransferase DltB (MBOAT superfamily)
LGLQLILWGFFKKVVIADNLAPVVDKTFKIMAYASPVDLLISWYFFAFQIYCDFSGYSDIAVGTSLLLGIRLMENFRRPYLSVSTAEFWSGRWHISLSRWFRDYLYFPLGGSRRGLPRQYLNTMIVFIISGLWHSGLGYGIGWNFMVWGALNGFYQWMGLATRGLWRAAGTQLPSIAQSGVWHGLRILFTFHLILLSWVFFRAGSIEQAVIGLRKVAASATSLPKVILNYPFTTEHMFGAGLIAFLLLVELLDEKRPLTARLAELPRPLRWGIYYTLLAGLLLLGRWQSQQFIYMQF